MIKDLIVATVSGIVGGVLIIAGVIYAIDASGWTVINSI